MVAGQVLPEVIRGDVAAEHDRHGFPKRFSSDPTQGL